MRRERQIISTRFGSAVSLVPKEVVFGFSLTKKSRTKENGTEDESKFKLVLSINDDVYFSAEIVSLADKTEVCSIHLKSYDKSQLRFLMHRQREILCDFFEIDSKGKTFEDWVNGVLNNL